MPSYKGFWSYVHSDDDADGGRISRLARDVSSEFEVQTGEAIDVFLDKDRLQWGENWRTQVDDALSLVAFFIPVLTPRYFLSAECRRELQYFARKASELGMRELILPLLYVDVPALHQVPAGDELISLVQGLQWEDWRELRFASPTSEEYRRAVARLASRLVAANRALESAPEIIGASLGTPVDDEPGALDRLAAAELALPEWNETIEQMSTQIELIGQIMTDASSQVQRSDRAGKGFGGRALVAKRTAARLADPAEKIAQLGQTFAKHMHDVDSGFKVIIQEAAGASLETPEEITSVCEFFSVLRRMAATSEMSLGSVEDMVRHASLIEPLARDLRPPLRRMREGLVHMVEARGVIREWVRLMDMVDIECVDGDAGFG